MTDLLLMRTALRESLRPKRLLIATLLTLLAPAIGLLWRLLTPAADFDPAEVYDSLVVPLVFSFVLTLLSVVNGTGVVSQEIEGRTIVYLLTRPLPRWRILLARFVANLGVVVAVSLLSAVLVALAVFGPAGLSRAGLGPDLTALAVGALVYGSVFLLVGAAVPRPLVWGLLFCFGWELLVPQFPGSFAKLSIMSYLRVLASREVTASVESAQQGGGGNLLLAFSRPPQVEIPASTAWIVLLAVAAVALLAALVVFSTREYVPREDAE